jgi:hypothetical protein
MVEQTHNMKKIIFLLFLPLISYSQSSIKGITKANTEIIPFVNIVANTKEGKSYGTSSDIDGNYTITLPNGEYTFSATAVGFKNINIKRQIVSDTELNFLFEEDKQLLNEVVVTSVAKKETVTTTIATIRSLSVVSDAISTENIKRTPDRTVGDVLKRVNGVTIQNDRFVLVRGLNDRYNLAFLNKTSLPSTEPDRRAFSFDIIPSNLIDNIFVYKSASPDMPGDFGGGIVYVTTKEVTEDFTSLTLGTGWGSVSSLRGYEFVRPIRFPSLFPSTYDFRSANNTDKIAYTKLIDNPAINSSTTIPNLNGTVSIGRDWGKWKAVFVSSIRNSFGVNYTQRKDWQSPNELAYNYNDTLYNRTTLISSLLNITHIDKNRWSWKTVYNYQNNNSFLKRFGENYDNLQDVRTTSSNHFNTSVLNSQFEGRISNTDFNIGYNYVYRTQPDYRVNPIVRSLNTEENFSTAWRDTYRFWSILNEHSITGGASHKIGGWKFGGGFNQKFRTFGARIFRYQNTDMMDEITNNTDRYDANVSFGNLFGMYDTEIGKWKVSGGIRNEMARFLVNTADFSGTPLELKGLFVNILPSVNFSYNLEKTKWRVSASKTVARPEFREVANFAYYDFVRNAQIIGNPDLRMAQIYNLDFKWELYPSKSETISFSTFGKNFVNPIEQVVDNGSVPSNLILTFTNPKSATLFGVEIEAKKNVTEWLSFYTNTSLMKSNVSVNGISRQMQGQSNYIVNGGVNFNWKQNAFNISYNRIGERISAVGFQGYGDIIENARDLVDITYLRKIGKAEIKLTINDVFAQPSLYYQKLQNKRVLIKTNNEQIVSFNLNYTL